MAFKPANKKKDDRGGNRGGGLFKRRKYCRFSAEKIEEIDYKDIDILGRPADQIQSDQRRAPADDQVDCLPVPMRHQGTQKGQGFLKRVLGDWWHKVK